MALLMLFQIISMSFILLFESHVEKCEVPDIKFNIEDSIEETVDEPSLISGTY